MSIVLLGSGPRAAWARALLPATEAVDGVAPSPDALRVLSAQPPGCLLLVDPLPFAAEDPAAAALPPPDRLRADATRAVFALEVARRAGRTVTLAGDAAAWPAQLDPGAAPVGPAPLLSVPPVPDGLAAAAASFLTPLWAAAGTGRAPPLVLPAGVFFDGDVPGQPMPTMIEVAGRARIVAYGPYLPLPAGAWTARAWLGFSPDVGRMPFIIEADTGAGVSRGFCEAERGGFFSLDLEFRVDDPLHPLELRLITQDSALEGQAALIEVRLEPRQSVP